ncbi:hypothetical protein GCM10022243_21050 [Saccharothrix violaceirubra]|uniref:SurA-like protein n=1 Tax=Saccharothrix violaceirubra TaxID=413306 RepID=A0A7W7WYH8_9PSEU|nr:SurA N-terminal domain-containing protein [Saccharothrix violaceirubra]MBB4968554.1 hypothetical protein [Saccharothrix violaceirubra]
MRTLPKRFTLVGAVVALLVTAGCASGPSKVGTAAIVGGTVIPLEQVQQRLDRVLKKEPGAQAALKQHKLDGVARLVAGTAVQHELTLKVAQREGITVDEADIAEAIEDAGGAEAGSEGTVYDSTTFRDRAVDQLLQVALARKYVDRLEVTFDYFYSRDKNEALDKAAKIAKDPGLMAGYVNAAPKGNGNQQLAKRGQVIKSSQEPTAAAAPFFGVKPGTVVAYPPSEESAQWLVVLVTDRRDDAKPSEQSSSEQLTPQILERIGLRLVQYLGADLEIEINPRYGVWDVVGIGLAASEGERGGYVAEVAGPPAKRTDP